MTEKDKEIKYMEADHIDEVAPDFKASMQAMLKFIQDRKLKADEELAPAEDLTSEPNGVVSPKEQLEFKEGMSLEDFLEEQQDIVAKEMMAYMVNSNPDKDE
ncbi:hypothetical protein CKF54_04290 [Psittacicella hinzii]|uniref:Uncharacterized protein n=1 Tax=Psittacicella hinzii TaxID=2028575 RepID=A0A3A1Y5E3_9GAMM|nr:hypothetical protein [Psittacicella hinzii]RIY32681.1 hypothetical protein CKF54_04290 [Psittacicella hinzii]